MIFSSLYNWYKNRNYHTMIYVIGLITVVALDYFWKTHLPKNRQKSIKKMIVGNGQITHNFFDFQKFCANMAFLAFIASIIQDNAC